MVMTFSSLALATTLGGGYVWAQGGFEPTTDLTSVAAAPEAAPADPSVPTGYGVLGSAAPAWGPTAVTATTSSDPTDTDTSAPAEARPRTPAARSIAATGTARTSGVPLASGYGLTGSTAATGAGAATGFGTLPAGTTDGSTAYADTSASSTTGTTGATSTTPGTAATTSGAATGSTSSAGSTATTGGATTPRADLPPAPVGDGNGAAFGVATFNLLGASHTPPGGTRASGAARMVGALRVLAQHDVSVVGFQEMERSQHVAFEQQAKGWRSYPTSTTGKNFGLDTVAWRADTWQLVKAAYVMSPSWRGKDKPMPYVLLKHKGSGRTVYVSTFHNEVGRSAQAQAWREEATRRQVALVNRLAATGVPQLLTGDMNERDSWFCRITGATRLHSATGGTNDAGGCRPVRPYGIDWVLGSPELRFSGTVRDQSSLVRSVTDHSVLVARAAFPSS